MQLSNQQLLQNKLFIANKWLDALNGQSFDVINPANNEILATVADGGANETGQAIQVASEAF